MSSISVVTAWNRSPVYGAEYPRQLSARLDAPLTVIQDSRWPGWWCKMAAFDPGRFGGPMLMMDLDTIPVSSVRPFLEHNLTESIMLRDFYTPTRPGSGVMLITESDRAKVWRAWIAGPDRWMRIGGGLGDGKIIAGIIKPRLFIQDVLPGLVCSYKVDCQHEQPAGVSLICYHGNPRPHETQWDTGNAAKFMRRAGVPFPPSRSLKLEQQSCKQP